MVSLILRLGQLPPRENAALASAGGAAFQRGLSSYPSLSLRGIDKKGQKGAPFRAAVSISLACVVWSGLTMRAIHVLRGMSCDEDLPSPNSSIGFRTDLRAVTSITIRFHRFATKSALTSCRAAATSAIDISPS